MTIMKQNQEAKENFQKAIPIFEAKGMAKMVKECKQKIKMVNQRSKQGVLGSTENDQMMAAAEIVDESAYDSQGDGGYSAANPGIMPHLQHQGPATGKKKRAVGSSAGKTGTTASNLNGRKSKGLKVQT